eukprot:11159210-Lingulodinium_polyedra.AAC.1
MVCVFHCSCAQCPRESCSDARSDARSVVATPRVSRFPFFGVARRRPYGGRRTECRYPDARC